MQKNRESSHTPFRRVKSIWEKKSEKVRKKIWNAWKDVLFNALKVWKWGFAKSKKVWNQIKIWKSLTSLYTPLRTRERERVCVRMIIKLCTIKLSWPRAHAHAHWSIWSHWSVGGPWGRGALDQVAQTLQAQAQVQTGPAGLAAGIWPCCLPPSAGYLLVDKTRHVKGIVQYWFLVLSSRTDFFIDMSGQIRSWRRQLLTKSNGQEINAVMFWPNPHIELREGSSGLAE